MTEQTPSVPPEEKPSEDILAEQPITRPRRDVLRDLAWFELTRCMDDDGPRHMSVDSATEVLFGRPAPAQELREES